MNSAQVREVHFLITISIPYCIINHAKATQEKEDQPVKVLGTQNHKQNIQKLLKTSRY